MKLIQLDKEAVEAVQLTMFQTPRQPIRFVDERGKPTFPFQTQEGWIDWKCSHAGRYYYWQSEINNKEVNHGYFSPHVLNVSFWKDDKTPEGELKSSTSGAPDREKKIWAERLARWEAEAMEQWESTPYAPPKKPRKKYKWSRRAKIRNRQRLLRGRIEKKHGYDPDRPTLFDKDLRDAIEKEFQERIHDNPDYFIKGLTTRGFNKDEFERELNEKGITLKGEKLNAKR